MRLLLLQNKVHRSIDDTLRHVENLIDSRTEESFDFLALPEMFISPYQVDKFADYAQDDQSNVIRFLKNLAKKHSAYIIGGSVPERSNGKLYNTTYVFDKTGNLLKKYRKIHLFSITYPDNTTFKESDVLSAGDELGLFETEFGTMGLMICFDIRYPQLAEKLTEKGAKAIFVPAAFNSFTGPLHWELAFKSRATDNQLYVIGISPSSDSYGTYNTYGHSLIANPFGEIVEKLGANQGLIECTLDLSMNEQVRKQLPIRKNKIPLDEIE